MIKCFFVAALIRFKGKNKAEINDNPKSFKKLLLIRSLKFYLIHQFYEPLGVYRFLQCNDRQ